MNKRKGFSVNIGFSSVMMIFITICLVTFSTLSFLTANSDYRLSTKTADKTTSYYLADTAAHKMLAEIDQALASQYQTSENETAYYDTLSTNIVFFELPDRVCNFSISTENEHPVISYEVTISDVQVLCVSLEVQYPKEADDTFYKIIKWQSQTSNSPVEADTYLHLFGS